MPRLCEFYSGICLTTEEKARKNLSQGKKNLSQVKKNLSQSTVCILPKLLPLRLMEDVNVEEDRIQMYNVSNGF